MMPSRAGTKTLAAVALVVLLMVAPQLSEGDSLGPAIIDVSWSPPNPYWDEGLNVSANVTDPDGVASVMLQWCIGDICYPPVPMNVGEGNSYWYFVDRTFPNTTVTFDILAQDTQGNPSSYAFNVTFRPRPTSLLINATAVPYTLYPGENFTVTGRLTLNTGEPPSSATVRVYLSTEEVSSGQADPFGGFNITVKAPESSGNYTYLVVGEGEGFRAETEVEIRVIERPVADLVLHLMFTGTSRKEGGIFLFEDDLFRGRVEVENSGTAPAGNLTITVFRDVEEVLNESYSFSLAPGERWGTNFTADAGAVGRHMIVARVSTPHEEISLENNYQELSYEVLPPSAAPQQKVLVELFTSTTCEPCISSEHALDYLRYLRGDNATVVAYVMDDPTVPTIEPILSSYGVSGTPTVVFDGGYRVEVGGGEEEELLQTYQTYLNESLLRYRDPIWIELSSVNITGNLLESLTITVHTAGASASGLYVTLYGITPYMGPRGFNGVPIRYSVAYYNLLYVPDMDPEDEYTTTIYPAWYFGEDGISVVAALRENSGTVLSHDIYEEAKRPPFYVQVPTGEVDIPPASSREVTITLESFLYSWEENPLPVTADVELAITSGREYEADGPPSVTIGSEALVGEEWGGRLKMYRTSFAITFSAGEDPSERGEVSLTFTTTSLGGWSYETAIKLSRGVPEIVLLRSDIGRKGDYVVITASFTNMSEAYTVQLEYVFYGEGEEGPSRFASMLRSPNSTYFAEITPGGDYPRLKYRIYVRDRGEIIYTSDWIDVKVPPGAGEVGDKENTLWYPVATAVAVLIVLGAYLFAARKKRKIEGIEE